MLSYTDIPYSFWGHALEMTTYLLNFVPLKVVSTRPKILWIGHKPSMKHILIWGSQEYMLKRDPSKLESRPKVRFFVGYPKETKGYLFYDPKDQKVVVSTKA